MADLILPAGPAELLEAVRRPIALHLGGEHCIHLGGGTALAARWQHRHSTDVDLFVDGLPYQRLFENKAAFLEDLNRAADIADVSIARGFARIICQGGGEISISTSSPLTDNPVSTDTVRGTGVLLEHSSEILAKKLYYRMIGNGLLVPRDLYDFATARRLDPDALQDALKTLEEGDLNDIATELRYLRVGWMQQQKQLLIRPINGDDAKNAVRIVRTIVLRHLRSRVPRDRRNSAWER